MANDNSTDDVINSEERQDTGASRAAQKGKDKATEQSKKAIKKMKEAKEKGKYAKGLGKLVGPILAIIVIIIMVIGFIAFAINMPGSVVDKIMNTIDSAGLTIKKWWTEEDLSTISDTEMHDKKLELLNYLEEMGYDVVGMGFVQSVVKQPSEEDSTKMVITDYVENIQKNDGDSEEEFETEDGTTIQPSYLFSYYLADQRMYVGTHLKLLHKLLGTVNADETWGQGMLNIYGDISTTDGVEIDRENLTLTFKNMHGFFKTDVYQYNIDGWAGRYGTPLELLLAIHSSTMMPDLAYEFVSNENLQTVVNIEAKEVALELDMKLVNEATKEEVNINFGNKEDPAIDIAQYLYYDESAGEYGVRNIDELKKALEEQNYSVVSLYKTFTNWTDAFDNWYSGIKTSAANNSVGEVINASDAQKYYVAWTTEQITELLGDAFLGTTDTVKVGATLGNGIRINSISDAGDGSKNINITDNSGNGRTCEFITVPSINGIEDQLIESEVDEYGVDFTDSVNLELYYERIFSGIDTYFSKLYSNKLMAPDSLNYKYSDSNSRGETKYYSSRFFDWCNNLTKAQTFDEYIESQGLQNAISYEKEGRYKFYRENYYKTACEPLNQILDDIQKDLNVQQDTSTVANELYNELANEIGLTPDQVTEVYNLVVNNEDSIKTFVPQIKSVVKHWYKDIVFNYKNAAKGTVFQTEYPGEGLEGYTLYYEFKTVDDDYPVQDGDPYVIKGDSVTKSGEEASNEEIRSLGNELPEGYTLGNGYKTARKLFTQGYYYQYDGSTETANEIANAKRIESYNEGEVIKVRVTNGKITYVYKDIDGTTPSDTPTSIRYKKDGRNVDDPSQADTVVKYYCIRAPKKYVSAAEGNYAETRASANNINATLELLGSDLRRKPVSMSNNSTSLTALSMLEGMHSLDADYIYREFKEFLIELGYYSRAEIEAVETNILDWFMPGFTPEQWPPVKDEETMLEYGTTLLASANVKDATTVSAEKITSLDNFIFYTDTERIIDQSTVNTAGTNVKIISGALNADDIAAKIISDKPTAICIYAEQNAKNDETAVAKTKQLIQDIRAKLTEEKYKSPDIAIYVMQVLPLSQPDILAEASTEIVEQNKRISNYNTSLYNVCLNQDNVKFIDATSGCVTGEGWLDSKATAVKISQNVISKIVRKNVSNGGFEEDITVITPGAGYVTAITDNEITIEFSVEQDSALRSIDGFSMIITGIKVDEELKNNFASGATTDEDGNKQFAIKKGAVIGVTAKENIKLILRDRNKAILGNIEDYMDLPKKQEITEWEMFYYTPYESGAVDTEGFGPARVGGRRGKDEHSTDPNEVAVGICQWTSIQKEDNVCNNIPGLCKWLYEQDPSLCAELNTFVNWSISDFCSDYAKHVMGDTSELVSAFKHIDETNHDEFLALQMQYALEEKTKIMESQGVMWLFDRPGVVVGTYMSLINWAPNAGWHNAIDESMTNEKIVIALLNMATGRTSTAGSLNNRWNSQARYAIDALSGEISADDIEEYTRNGFPSTYANGNNDGYIAAKMKEYF